MEPNRENNGPAQLIERVKALTGITDHALARKLGVPVEVVLAVEANTAELPEAAADILEEFHARASDSKRTLVAPRIPAPQVESAVHCGDSLELLRTLPESSFDSIISDIPYGISLDDWDVLHSNTNSALLGSSEAQRKAGAVFAKRRKPINGWSSADRDIPREYFEWCKSWAAEWLRVLKPGGSAIVFAGRRLAHRCVQALEDEGFNYRDMLAWMKPRAVFRAQRLSTVLQKRGELAEAERWEGWRVGNLGPVFEPIIWCFKPYDVTIADNVLDHMVGAMNADEFKRLTGSYDNVIAIGLAPEEGGLHEAQKPVALLEVLLELCTPADGIVLDPFAGSGSTAIAALRRERRYLMIERDESLCDVIRDRVSNEAEASKLDQSPPEAH